MRAVRAAPMRRRLMLATLAAAVLTGVATAAVALGSVGSVDIRAARNALSAQAEGVAEARPVVRAALIETLSEVDGELVAHIPPRGAPAGSAAHLVDERVSAVVRGGGAVSATIPHDGQDYLVEARPTAQGGGVLVAQDAESVRTLTPAMLARIAFALGIGLVVAVAAAAVVARSLGRPLASLAERARLLTEGERGIAAAGASGIAEVDRIDEALRSLDASLLRSEGRQSEFLLSVSHEIRTPLTTLRGYAEALSDAMVQPGEMAEVGRTLGAEVDRLSRFTEDLLALARLEADDFTLDLVDGVDAAGILESLAEAWRPRAAAAGVAVLAHGEAGLPPLRTDPHRLRQLVDGLVDNALRVSPDRGRIDLAARRGGRGGVVIEVSDQGPGLTVEDASQAFERGRLRERYRQTRPVGAGLGLSIASRLVERMGGSITAVPGDAGATFRIDLPLSPTPGP